LAGGILAVGKFKEFFSVWGVLLVLNQVFIFHGCFNLYCLLAALPHTGLLAFLWVLLKGKLSESPVSDEKNKHDPAKFKKDKERKKAASIQAVEKYLREKEIEECYERLKTPTKPDPLKEKGDQYERFIGTEFEKKGDLVIYNGFIKGYKDQGVDIISISPQRKAINLVQCKNWTKMRMTLEHITDIYSKLEQYDFDCFQLQSYEISEHTQYTDIYVTLQSVKQELGSFTIRKTLYIASDKVVELEVGPHLTMLSPTIFKFKDMKIVMKKLA